MSFSIISVSDYKERCVPEAWLGEIVSREVLDAVLVLRRSSVVGESADYLLITTERTLKASNYAQKYNNIQNLVRAKTSSKSAKVVEAVASDSDLVVIKNDVHEALAGISNKVDVTYNDSPEKKFINDIALAALRKTVSDVHFYSYTSGACKIVFEQHGISKVWKEITTKEADAMINAALFSFSPEYKGHGDIKERISASIPLPLFEPGQDEPVAHVTLRLVRDMSDTGTHTVLRVNDNKTKAKSMAELGISPDVQVMLKDIISLNDGMLIITAPTGQGKTTTLNALLADVPAERKIIYAADPVEGSLGREFVVPYSVDDSHEDSSYGARIKTALRQAPRIVCIAEARNSEVLKSAFGAALTGHFCGTTYHAADVFSAIIRILDDGIPAMLMASGVLKGLASQRLVKVLCSDCKIPSKHHLFGDCFIRNKAGCPACEYLGVVRRANITEVLVIDDKVCEFLFQRDIQAIRKHAEDNGFRSMASRALDLIKSGVIDPHDAVESIPGMSYQKVFKYPAVDSVNPGQLMQPMSIMQPIKSASEVAA